MIALLGHPCQHGRLGLGAFERRQPLEHTDQLGEYGGGVLLPALAYILLGIRLGCLEEEAGLLPEIGHEIDASLHQAHGTGDILVSEIVGVHTVGAEHRLEKLGHLGVGCLLEILVVEPASLLVGKLCARARAVVE